MESDASSPLPWRLPDVRRDRERHLARLMRDILWLDACQGCESGNEHFQNSVGVDDSTIRRLLAVLKDCRLITIEYGHGRQRRIQPLVTAIALLKAGWKAFAAAVADRDRWPAVVRQFASALLSGHPAEPDLSRLGLSAQEIEAEAHLRKCAASARRNARLFPDKGSEAKKTTTVRSVVTESKPSPVVVSPAEKSEPVPEAISLAVEAGLDREVARKAVGEKPIGAVRTAIQAAKAYAASHDVRSLPALLFTAIRSGWLPPAPSATHPSDLGRRPEPRVTRAPKPIPSDWLPGVPHEEARGYCNEAFRQLQLGGTNRPSDKDIRDRARQLWRRRFPDQAPMWESARQMPDAHESIKSSGGCTP